MAGRDTFSESVCLTVEVDKRNAGFDVRETRWETTTTGA